MSERRNHASLNEIGYWLCIVFGLLFSIIAFAEEKPKVVSNYKEAVSIAGKDFQWKDLYVDVDAATIAFFEEEKRQEAEDAYWDGIEE